MSGCPYLRKPENCAHRQAWTTPAPSDCRACDFFGRKAGSGSEAEEPVVKKSTQIIPKIIPGRIPAPEKEGGVDREKVKENILRVLGRKGPMTSSSLKLYAGKRETREDFLAACDALAGEGKVVTKEGTQPGSLRVMLPGAAQSNDATVPSKKPRSVNLKSATPPIKKSAKTERPVSAPRSSKGNGVYTSAIADLEAKRSTALDQVEKIDRALETLRALA